MHLSKRFLFVFLSFFIAGALVTPGLISAKAPEAKMQEMLKSHDENVLFINGYVDINNATQEEVYKFVSDLSNDHLWYPGTLSSVKVSGNGGPGTVYKEQIYFNGLQDITATVLATHPNHSFWFTSDGILTNITKYTLLKRPNHKVRFVMTSVVKVPPGVTKEFMEQYLTATFQSLLQNLGKTGEVHVPAKETT